MMSAALAAPSPEYDAPRHIDVAELRRMLKAGGEVALLDVREEHDAAQGHILLATLLPLSRLELRILALVPRRATRIVICDADGTLAARAARILHQLGYHDLQILGGGVGAWRAAGHPLFTTTHVLAKTFGGIAERAFHTPHITAHDLKARLDAGADVAIFDARTFAEFQAGSLPGAVSCPLAELPSRVPAALNSPDTLVVINCASRTRGILGAQSVRNLSLPNPVVVLENGVMAWSLAGGELVQASSRVAPEPSEASLATRRKAAGRLAARFAIPLIGADVLRRFQADLDRSLYVFDVRTPEAYEAGHAAGTRSAPGGQLIMTLQQIIGTHMARVVLLDRGDGLAAVTTALWLAQIARHQVFVMIGKHPGGTVVGPEAPSIAGSTGRTKLVDAGQASRLLDANEAVVFDVEDSLAYRHGHIPAARFAIRARLPDGLESIAANRKIIVTSSDGVLAELTAQDLAGRDIVALRGGTAAWTAAGLPLEAGDGQQLHPFEDLWPSPMRAISGRLEAFEDYLRWETSLADQVAGDDTVRFDIRA